MKTSKIRLPDKRKALNKILKTQNKKKKQEKVQFDVTPAMIDSDVDPPTPDADYELASNCENEIDSVENEFQEAETVEDIQEFIRETDQFLKDDEIDETTMPEVPISILLPANESKNGKRQTVLEAKVDSLEKKLDVFGYELKGIKDILKIRARTSKNTGQIAAYCKEACVFPLIPKFQLKKVSQVERMELDVHASNEYKEQLVSDKNS